MAKDSWENEVSERKTAYQEGIERHNERCVDVESNPTYAKCRKGWIKFIRGEFTSQQLEEYLGVNETNGEEIKELFDGQDEFGTIS